MLNVNKKNRHLIILYDYKEQSLKTENYLINPFLSTNVTKKDNILWEKDKFVEWYTLNWVTWTLISIKLKVVI